MRDEYMLAAKALDETILSLERELQKMKAEAARYRRLSAKRQKTENARLNLRREFDDLLRGGLSRYGAALKLSQKWSYPLDTVFFHIFRSERMARDATREIRNDHVVRLHRRGLANDRIARHSVIVRLNGGKELHPNSIPRIVRQTLEKGAPPTRLY